MNQAFITRSKIILFVALFIGFIPVAIPSTLLSEKAQISLLTASAGDELYSVFGHSALRVTDPEREIDLVFNYGTFDFNTPGFYTKFVRGKLMYKLSVSTMDQFVPEYQYEGRAIYEQVLDLSLIQKQKIFDFLLINRLPENAYYHYDFFYDNCATRIRDLVDDILQPLWPQVEDINEQTLAEIKSYLAYEYEYTPDLAENRTFRDMLQPFLQNMPWSAYGIDLALGLPADKVASPWDYMYLPDEMLIAFALAQHPDGRPMVSRHRIILPKTVELSGPGPVSPIMVGWLLFLLAMITLWRPRWSEIFDRVFFSIIGLNGIVIFFLWFYTDHSTTKANLNLLWAIPTHLYFIWFATYGPIKITVKWYFVLITILSFALLIFWHFIPQAFHPGFFPVVLIIGIKSALYSFNLPYLSKHLRSGA
jgi:hypothetical protein